MEVEFFKSKTWLRWLELRKKTYCELGKGERIEYRKLRPVVCEELTKLQPYIPPRRKNRGRLVNYPFLTEGVSASG